MPEMPELEVLKEVLGPQLEGRTIMRVTISPRFGFLLRTPPADLAAALEGVRIDRMWRRGKFLCFDLGGSRLVVNPMLGGRLHWSRTGDKAPPSVILTIALDDGQVLRLTDFARMARVYLVADADLETVPGWSELGPEADSIDIDAFRSRIRRHPGELKNLLKNQAFIAGIGNAYSDEVLHRARLLPLRKRATLQPEDIDRLHEAVAEELRSAVQKIRAQPHYEPHKQDRTFMVVHMRGGEACPRCGHRIAEIKAGGEVTNFCRGCQA